MHFGISPVVGEVGCNNIDLYEAIFFQLFDQLFMGNRRLFTSFRNSGQVFNICNQRLKMTQIINKNFSFNNDLSYQYRATSPELSTFKKDQQNKIRSSYLVSTCRPQSLDQLIG